MANQVLTALGLDITQFETAANKTDGITRGLAHGFELVDSAIRRIPLAGSLYAATIGQFVTVTADAVLQGREFARVMGTDVTHSLEGAVTQIDDITAAIERMNKVSFTRSIVDFWTLIKTRGQRDTAKEREEGINALIERRTSLIQKSVELEAREANARSAIVSGSELETEQTRIRLDYDQKILKANEEVNKIPVEKREQSLVDRLEAQKDLYKEIQDRELKAAASRFTIRQEELTSAVRIAELESQAFKYGLNSQKTQLLLQQEEARLAQREVDLSKNLTVQDEQRAKANLAIIQAQQKLNQLKEIERQRALGGRGRAAERQEQRRAARNARIAQSRQRQRALDQHVSDIPGSSGLSFGGLSSGGLTSGSLARPKSTPLKQQPAPVSNEIQKFMQDVLTALTK